MPAGPSSLGNRDAYGGPTVRPRSSTSDGGVPPLIGSAGMGNAARSPGRGWIPIEGAARAAVRAGVHADPYAFWMSYYKSHDETPGELHETVRLLGASQRMRDVEAALRGYLTHRARNAEAWMYRALALAIRMNHGSPADVSMSLNYAADLAQRSHNPNDLVSVADTLLMLGQLDRVGALVDEAAERVPHRNDPLMMSVNLALRLRTRYAWLPRWRSCWPWVGRARTISSAPRCRRVAALLAKSLREDGRDRDAVALLGSPEGLRGSGRLYPPELGRLCRLRPGRRRAARRDGQL